MKKLGIVIFPSGMLMCTLVAFFWHPSQNRFTIVNQSDQAIRLISVAITQEKISFEDLSAGSSVSSRFHIGADDHFVLRGELVDGTAIAADCGYVTNGMIGGQATFII